MAGISSEVPTLVRWKGDVSIRMLKVDRRDPRIVYLRTPQDRGWDDVIKRQPTGISVLYADDSLNLDGEITSARRAGDRLRELTPKQRRYLSQNHYTL